MMMIIVMEIMNMTLHNAIMHELESIQCLISYL